MVPPVLHTGEIYSTSELEFLRPWSDNTQPWGVLSPDRVSTIEHKEMKYPATGSELEPVEVSSTAGPTLTSDTVHGPSSSGPRLSCNTMMPTNDKLPPENK